jgi:hypothetical protein
MKAIVTAALLAMAGSAAGSHVLAQTAPVETAEPVEAGILALTETLRMGETFAVMVEEGQAYGASIEEQMFPGQGGPRWSAMVATIYDAPKLRQEFEAGLQDALRDDPATVAAAQAFFASDLGQRVLGLEIEARSALLDEAAEEAARVEAERMQVDRDPRFGLIRDMAEAGDLIEMNVAGALTANLAFFQGMSDVGIPGMVMDEEQMMTDVWGQEDSIRDETAKWLYPYLALAYKPLTDEELKTYIDFMGSAEGKRMNAALFVAFDRVFGKVSFELGRGAALVMQGNDI